MISVRRVDRDLQGRPQGTGDPEEQRLLDERVAEGHRGDGEGEGHRGEEDRADAAQGRRPEPGPDAQRRQEVEAGEGAAEGAPEPEGRAKDVHQPRGAKDGKAGAAGEAFGLCHQVMVSCLGSLFI